MKPGIFQGFVQVLPLDFDGLEDAEAFYATRAREGYCFDGTLEMPRQPSAPTQWWKPTEI